MEGRYATLENEDFHTFVRAASAIQGNEIVTLNATRDSIDTPVIQFVFGERMEFSNKVEFHVIVTGKQFHFPGWRMRL